MKLIVGLGNPGPKYAATRHNMGFRAIDLLARRWGINTQREKFRAFFGQGLVEGQSVVLLKPITFMNRSGQAVLTAGQFYQLELPDLLVISDDLALPPGAIRFRKSGSAGKHNGLQDIIDRLGRNDFARLRIGIGAAPYEASDYVLQSPTPNEEPLFTGAIERAADAVHTWVIRGPDETMNRFNAAVEP